MVNEIINSRPEITTHIDQKKKSLKNNVGKFKSRTVIKNSSHKTKKPIIKKQSFIQKFKHAITSFKIKVIKKVNNFLKNKHSDSQNLDNKKTKNKSKVDIDVNEYCIIDKAEKDQIKVKYPRKDASNIDINEIRRNKANERNEIRKNESNLKKNAQYFTRQASHEIKRNIFGDKAEQVKNKYPSHDKRKKNKRKEKNSSLVNIRDYVMINKPEKNKIKSETTTDLTEYAHLDNEGNDILDNTKIDLKNSQDHNEDLTNLTEYAHLDNEGNDILDNTKIDLKNSQDHNEDLTNLTEYAHLDNEGNDILDNTKIDPKNSQDHNEDLTNLTEYAHLDNEGNDILDNTKTNKISSISDDSSYGSDNDINHALYKSKKNQIKKENTIDLSEFENIEESDISLKPSISESNSIIRSVRNQPNGIKKNKGVNEGVLINTFKEILSLNSIEKKKIF